MCGKIFKWVVVAIGFLSTLGASTGQTRDNYAAVLTVLYSDVEIQRAGTAIWLSLSPDSVAPFGEGDTLRTGPEGRAYLSFSQLAEVLVLPETRFTLSSYAETEANRLQLSVSLEGLMVQRLMPDTVVDTYHLQTDRMSMMRSPQWVAVWAFDGQPTVVAVEEGTAILTTTAGEFEVGVQEAVRIDLSSNTDVIQLQPPLNAARVESDLTGCPGSITTVGFNDVNVRVGPGISYTPIGSVVDGAMIPLMGISASGRWYRIQLLSGYGWIEASLVSHRCQNLPVLPDNRIEENLGLREVNATERALLRPFFGAPDVDPFVYITLNNSEGILFD